VRVPADAAPQGELLPGRGVADVQGALLPRQLDGLGANRALGQLGLGHVRDPLEVVVAGVAEVGGAEAEEDGHGAAVPGIVCKRVDEVQRNQIWGFFKPIWLLLKVIRAWAEQRQHQRHRPHKQLPRLVAIINDLE